MRVLGIILACAAWLFSWLVAPASWWLNEHILDEQAFNRSVQQALQIDDVDAAITDRATSEVMDRARAFVTSAAPVLAPQAQALLDAAQPTVTGIVGRAVTSQPGERAMLAMADQMHSAFVAWLEQDTLGRPGLQADLGSGRARFDLDELLAGQSLSLGPVSVPLDALALPGLEIGVPLPPDWMRIPLTLVRDALRPALLGIAVSGVSLVVLDRGRPRVLGLAAVGTALVVAAAALLVRGTWAVSVDEPDLTLTRALSNLLVQPWVSAYTWVAIALVAVAGVALGADRMVAHRRQA